MDEEHPLQLITDKAVKNKTSLEGSKLESNKREKWSGKMDFILSLIACCVGIGNIWRFPYLCYKNGGGAFLVPYIIMVLFGGFPISVFEIGIGQYTSKGGFKVWEICPLFQGIGYSCIVVIFLCNIYYIVVVTWTLYYFGLSLTSELPWTTCNNPWNTEKCLWSTKVLQNTTCLSILNETTALPNQSLDMQMIIPFNFNRSCELNGVFSTDPVEEFWERKVLQKTDSINEPGGIVPELALCLLAVWIVVYLAIWRGIHWTGKVVYFTAIFPYLILLAILIRAVTLPGADYGMTYYLKPDFTRLKDPVIWIDGGTQVFFSYAIAIGALISLGSYNKFHNNFYRDTIITCFVNSGTSLVSGLAVFSILGYMAKEQGVSIDTVVKSGPGLAFIVYPKAVSLMPLSPLWSVAFFFMLFIVGFNTQFIDVEAFVTMISDIFPIYLYKKKGRMIFTALYCLLSYLFGLSMISRGGIYIFQLFDYYSASGMVLLWITFWECIVIGWIFGAERFCESIEQMIGYRVNRLIPVCWKFLTPILTAAIFIYELVRFSPIKYSKTEVFPVWAQTFGMSLALSSMCCIPILIVWKIFKTEGPLMKRLRLLAMPKLTDQGISMDYKE